MFASVTGHQAEEEAREPPLPAPAEPPPSLPAGHMTCGFLCNATAGMKIVAVPVKYCAMSIL